MELGKRIKQLRLRHGMTQEQLAESLGIGAQSVSKGENAIAMPDITLLPQIAEVFGVSIDDLFDLTTEQRMNRMENRMDAEENLPPEVFLEYEDFLKTQLGSEEYKKRATDLIAYLYWHRMNSYGLKAKRYARESIKMAPDEKVSQWVLQKAEGHAVWDWNMANHTVAIDFYNEIIKEHPESRLSYYYLLDNLIADHRADEAEEALKRVSALKDTRPVINEVYRAHIALARFDEKTADGIIESLIADHPDDFACLFEAAQYYAMKCDYDKAIGYYERSFEKETRRPRYTDELMGIADIYQIKGEYRKAAETCDRIIALLKDEWGYAEDEDSEFKNLRERKARLLAKAQ